jgi:TPR repeat protein
VPPVNNNNTQMEKIPYPAFQARYQYDPVSDRIGGGGFGEVFKAYDRTRHQYVAIKIAPVSRAGAYRLLREVELVKKTGEHENLAWYEHCQTYTLPDGEKDFAVMQYYPEGDLAALLRRHPQLSDEEKTDILRGVLRGIQHLHRHGIIWRDCKPSNILCVRMPNGQLVPKVSDLGLGKEQAHPDAALVSQSFIKANSYIFHAPELARGHIRENSDLWSLGVVAYWLFAAQYPDTGIYQALPEVVGQFPQPVRTLVEQCLIPDPTQRIGDAAACLTILDGSVSTPLLTEQADLLTRPPEPRIAPAPAVPKPQTKQTMFSKHKLTLLLLAIAICIGAYYYLRVILPAQNINDGITAYYACDFENARDLLEKQPNNPAAQYYTGMMYLNGFGGKPEKVRGYLEIEKSADQGYLYGRFAKANCLWNGRGVSKDTSMGIYLAKEIMDTLRLGAKQGDKELQYYLGICNYYGLAIKHDAQQAYHWLQQSSEQGHHLALLEEATSVMIGYASKSDPEKALQMIEPLIKKNHPYALLLYAMCLESGIGTIKNEEKAGEFYKKVADMANEHGLFGYAKLMIEGRGMVKNEEEGARYMREAAEQGYSEAQHMLAYYYEEGIGVPQNLQNAVEWYNKAIDQQHPVSMNNLGLIYYNGKGSISKNTKKGMELLRRAADLGNEMARKNIRVIQNNERIEKGNQNVMPKSNILNLPPIPGAKRSGNELDMG